MWWTLKWREQVHNLEMRVAQLEEILSCKDQIISYLNSFQTKYVASLESRQARLSGQEVLLDERIGKTMTSLVALIEEPQRLATFKEAIEAIRKK